MESRSPWTRSAVRLEEFLFWRRVWTWSDFSWSVHHSFKITPLSGSHPSPHAMHSPDLPGQFLRRIDGSGIDAGVSGEFTHDFNRHAINERLAHKGVTHPVSRGFLQAPRIQARIRCSPG